MKITKAEFVKSSTRVHQKPEDRLPEFAFIGRSNVGKSSLINMLCANNKLAKTSQTPGKTQLVNHFRINDKWYLVDLPGYGYAKLGGKAREELQAVIWDYILHSEELVMLFVLLDSRHDMQKIDLAFMARLGEEGIDPAACEEEPLLGESGGRGMLGALPGGGKEEILGYIGEVLETL